MCDPQACGKKPAVLPPKKRTRNSRFSLVCYRRNRVTLSPEPPGLFRFGLARAGPARAVDCPEAAAPAVCKVASALELHPCSALSSDATSILCGELMPMSITRLNSVSYWLGVW